MCVCLSIVRILYALCVLCDYTLTVTDGIIFTMGGGGGGERAIERKEEIEGGRKESRDPSMEGEGS